MIETWSNIDLILNVEFLLQAKGHLEKNMHSLFYICVILFFKKQVLLAHTIKSSVAE